MAGAHIRSGDEVIITAGDYRGQTGKVSKVDRSKQRVTVQGAGIPTITKNIRRSRVNPEGGQVELDRTFHMSNVSPVVGGKPTRVRFQTKDDGSKVRVAARDGSELGTLRGPRK